MNHDTFATPAISTFCKMKPHTAGGVLAAKLLFHDPPSEISQKKPECCSGLGAACILSRNMCKSGIIFFSKSFTYPQNWIPRNVIELRIF